MGKALSGNRSRNLASRDQSLKEEIILLRIDTFLCPHDDSQGALRFVPVCLSVSLSVCPSICHTLWYKVCVINSSYSFQWIFLKPCIVVVDIMKMCIWVFDGARINSDRITAFQT